MPHPPPSRSQRLEAYRRKRDAGKITEPFGREGIERPIVLTTFTTVGGLIPLWYGGGVMYQPMAITIIFRAVVCDGADSGVPLRRVETSGRLA